MTERTNAIITIPMPTFTMDGQQFHILTHSLNFKHFI